MNLSIPDFPQIPDKIYFRIGEVSHLVGVDTHVLRYWEKEFAIVKPFRGKSKQRLYRRQDVEHLVQIKGLLHDQGYTISGAKKVLVNLPRNEQPGPGKALSATASEKNERLLPQIKKELRGILAQLGGTK